MAGDICSRDGSKLTDHLVDDAQVVLLRVDQVRAGQHGGKIARSDYQINLTKKISTNRLVAPCEPGCADARSSWSSFRRLPSLGSRPRGRLSRCVTDSSSLAPSPT